MKSKSALTKQHILVVDDEPDIRQILHDILQDEGYQLSLAENAQQAKRLFEELQPDLVLLDIWMPDEDGISVLKNWVERDQLNTTPVIMISGHGTVENAVEAVKLGAYDFLEKPLSTGKLLLGIERALENASLKQENIRLKGRLDNDHNMIAQSSASQELQRHIKLLGPTDSWIFITGESGTGKRMVAKKIHQHSTRHQHKFIELNLAAMPPESVAMHLFGSDENNIRFAGAFENAKGGSLVINEVLGLSLEIQDKLLSALRDKQYFRLGGTVAKELDVRVIVTTSGNPQTAVAEGTFRQDLYYLLNVIPIEVPSLRQRGKDLPELISVFIEDITQRNQLNTPELADDALEYLRNYSWPGNVRQLQNVIQRLLILNTGDTISAHDVKLAIGNDVSMTCEDSNTLAGYFEGEMREAKEQFERDYLKYHFESVNGNVSALAKKVGLERTHLYRKLKQLDVNNKS